MAYKVSVIIPIYNMEKYIGECLDSIINQTLSDIEILCIDDGSTDSTLQILKEYQDKYPNILIHHQYREGAGCARNYGIKNAKGKYVAFMDSDDFYPDNEVLETLYNGAEENNVCIAGGSLKRLVNGELTPGMNAKLAFDSEGIVYAFDYQYCYGFYRFIYSRELLEKNNILFPDLKRYQDPPFMLLAIINAEKMWTTPKVTYIYREFDKKIDYSSVRVICDVIKGFELMMQYSKKALFLELQKELVENIKNFRIHVAAHVQFNPDGLLKIIDLIAENIVSEELQKTFTEYWSKDNLAFILQTETEKQNRIEDAVKKYENIIIYGAGRIGKSVFDLISEIENINIVGFAVTNEPDCECVRNTGIFRIRDLQGYANDSTLIIAAGKERINREMITEAEKYGFTQFTCVTETVFDAIHFVPTEGKFAFDN